MFQRHTYYSWILAGLLLCILNSLHSQTNPATSHYTVNSILINPALSGAHGGTGFLAGYRYQWAGVPGAPQTAYFAADMAIPTAKSGVGLNLVHDRVGAYAFTTVQAAYAFKLPAGNWNISAGVNGGVSFQNLDGSKLITPGGDYDGDPNHNDDILPTDKFKSIRPELGVGLAAILPGKVEFGVSVQNIINLSTKISGAADNSQIVWGRTLHLHGMAEINTGEQFSIVPGLSFRTDFNNFQTDFSALIGFRRFIYTGIGIRGYNKNAFGALIPMLQFNPFKELKVRYSYDSDLGRLKKFSNGSHEVSLQYIIPGKDITRKPKIIYNPRFL